MFERKLILATCTAAAALTAAAGPAVWPAAALAALT